jgi:hypothetical protein
MGKFAFISWDWKGSMDPRKLNVINAAIGEATVIQDITDHSGDFYESFVRTPDLTLSKTDWNALSYAVDEGDELLYVYEIEDADEVFEMSQAEAKVLVKTLQERPELEPPDPTQGTPVTVQVTCQCGWSPRKDECPMCAKTEHEKTGHVANVRITEAETPRNSRLEEQKAAIKRDTYAG